MVSKTEILQGKILVVDDQKPNIVLIEQMLHNAGYTAVSSTMDPQKVCELHLIHNFDLILLDLQMPGMDGFQVMENLKQIEVESYLPVLVITAQPAHKLQALKSGAKDFVSKPFDLTEVLLRVHNMLEVRLLNKQTKSLYERVLEEQKVSKQLLLNVLPQSLVERLEGRPEAAAIASPDLVDKGYAEVTISFADVSEFTKFSEGASAQVLVDVLKDISARFDQIPENQREIYPVASLSSPELKRGLSASPKSLEMLHVLDQFNAHGRCRLKVRIAFEASPNTNSLSA
jgi:adenylate cyclase